MNTVDYKPLLEFCTTDRQSEIINACVREGSVRKASKALGISARNVEKCVARVRQQAVRRNYSPDHDMTNPMPEGAQWNGNTTLYKYPKLQEDESGKVLQWVRGIPDKVQEAQLIRDTIDSLAEEVVPIPEIHYGGGGKPLGQDFFSLVPLGDPHLGLRCWAEEVNSDWDIPIAMRVFNKVYSRLFLQAPPTEEVILVNTGDLFHADNITGVTTRGQNKLDLDGRPGKWIEAAIKLIQILLTACLKRYKRVHYVNVTGNHDDILGLMMGAFIDTFYQRTNRLTVQRGNNPFQYVERDNVLLGFAHGHTCNFSSLPGKMTIDQREAWGRTKLHHWIVGHVHHKQMLQYKEYPGCSVQSVGIIPPADSYAHGLGLGSQRDAQIIIINKKRALVTQTHTEQVESTD